MLETRLAMLKRTFFTRPGYDCVRHPCGERGCGTNPGANHGFHSDEWVWAVSDGQRALVFMVYSGVYPESVPKRLSRSQEYPKGISLSSHFSFPPDRESVLIKPELCDYVDGGKCWLESYSCAAAAKLVSPGDGTTAGCDSVFLSLEREFAKRTAGAAPTQYERCNACDGCGTVIRKSLPR